MAPSVLTLADATGLLRTAVLRAPQADPDFRREVGIAISRLPDAARSGLPREPSEALHRLLRGGNLDPAALQALALMTARLGAHELDQAGRVMQVVEAEGVGEGDPRQAVAEIFRDLEFGSPPTEEAFMAKMEDPRKGFPPFRTSNGTEVAFFRDPDQLPERLRPFLKGHWADGVGLIVFRNERANTVGMIFLHTLCQPPWSLIAQEAKRPVWQASGGSMGFSHGELTFQGALERVIDKGVAMTWKWRAIDELLRMAGIDIATELGGSKGLVLHGKGRGAKAKGLEVYAEVLNLLGITITGSDEGIEPEWADFLAELAPRFLNGSDRARYKGRKPVPWTAKGIHRSILKILDAIFQGRRESVLVQGYGGIGSQLVSDLLADQIPVVGISERRRKVLTDARSRGLKMPMFWDTSESWFWERGLARMSGIKVRNGVASIIEELSPIRIVSPNAGPHPFDFNTAAAMILSGVRAISGATNNQLGLDLSGSPEAMAWIFQAAGIFAPADFWINLMGALAVTSNAINLSNDQMFRVVNHLGDAIVRQYREAFLRKHPPYLYALVRAIGSWRFLLGSGRGIGGEGVMPPAPFMLEA